MRWYCLLLAIWILGQECYALWRTWRARRWPTASGEVVEVEVKWSGVMARGASPVVRYRYAVAGAVWESTRLKFGAQAGRRTERSARAAVRELVPGAAVRVHYNPDRPADAVLQLRVGGADVAVLLIGVAILAIAMRV